METSWSSYMLLFKRGEKMQHFPISLTWTPSGITAGWTLWVPQERQGGEGCQLSYSVVLKSDFNLCPVWQEWKRFFPNKISPGSIKCYFRWWGKCVCVIELRRTSAPGTHFSWFSKNKCVRGIETPERGSAFNEYILYGLVTDRSVELELTKTIVYPSLMLLKIPRFLLGP